MVKILAIGHLTHFQYHPFQDVAVKLKELAERSDFKFDCTEDPNELQIENLNRYDLLISYADAWEESLSADQMASILQFVSSGKGLLAIHCGISYNNIEYLNLIGAKFIKHPEFQPLAIKITNRTHPITTGLSDFIIEDELYMFEFYDQAKLDIFMECTYQGQNYPLAWTCNYGQGRVAYLAPGHLAVAFENPILAKAIVNSIHWLQGK